ncbi:mitochondrial potassium channel [Heteronotia binoei]|uniref:mitochondrial potassium channel n=1 Tax=Heteronotia binoei TaxID=13085 RepID=UPI00292EF5BD|nr:mitochondrial potassium channel [Heteronotia binoei]XP_060095304.1 mitochondrial potassium channel [Heteronotia binoei]XP_060095305.1 mitochondrial potassium channel [Heteronotia binoei]XP_060095306.1 mitochondrial potassium channel [Heteronotia binoei]XP_060095307.1 mitochondrial potassium channel [Heteronotia binoei]
MALLRFLCHNMQHHCLLALRSPRSCVHIARPYCSPASKRPEANIPVEVATSLLHRLTEAAKVLGRNSLRRISAAAQNWWDQYEEFVGINEVREAQGNVTEAEKRFMVARGIVREARETWESQQLKLKDIRDRLDRVSRDDSQYLELATLEHRLLQEEKRYRASYLTAEESEREMFSLFSAAVRESHEKERTRAEKTKNWSIIGSVLGAIIGVLGSTYVNRVRLQELKTLVLEAQKGPISLQEAIREQASSHDSQQRDLSDLVASLKSILDVAIMTSQEVKEGASSAEGNLSSSLKMDPLLVSLKEQLIYSKQMNSLLGSLQQQLSNLQNSFREMASEVQNIKSAAYPTPGERALLGPSVEGNSQSWEVQDVVLELCDTERRLEAQMKRNSIYSTAFTCTVFAFALPALYILLKGN